MQQHRRKESHAQMQLCFGFVYLRGKAKMPMISQNIKKIKDKILAMGKIVSLKYQFSILISIV